MRRTLKVGMIQSNYLPWRGYFDFIDEVDVFVVYDDVQYTRKDWRNRNRIKTSDGVNWITVPVRFSQKKPTLIKDAEIDTDQPWQRKHVGNITRAYNNAPFFELYSDELFQILERPFLKISELNVTLIKWCMDKLFINTALKKSWQLNPVGDRNQRIVNIVKQIGGTEYLVGPSARNYLDEQLFDNAGIGLAYKSYDYPPYPQQHGPFDGTVSIIDLLFNCGPASKEHLKSIKSDIPANQLSI